MQAVNSVRRILTIDDNDAIHGDFKKILLQSAAPSKLAGAKALLFGDKKAKPEPARIQFEVDSALQGEEGLAKLHQSVNEGKPYSVAFVDMRMPPGWDGLQTIQRLWEVDPDLQVVICSAFSDYSWDEISEKLGLTDRLLILKKPFDPAEVTQLATALSEKWELRRAAKLKMDELEQMVQERTQQLTHLAMYDKLTGLANRVLFHDRLKESIQKRNASSTYEFAVLFLDFDRFKLVNDSLGHDAGDNLLTGIAQRITAALQLAGSAVGNATAARLGGDEFTILIEGTTGNWSVHAFVESLQAMVATPYTIDGNEVQCTASIGVTTSDLAYESADDVLRDADIAMYHAKAAGKARHVFFDRRMHEVAAARLELESDLRHAMERNEFQLYYQPVVSLRSGELKGFEALLRWKSPKRGLVSPMDFIPCCEEMGLIVPLGMWVIRQACGQISEWTRKYPHHTDLKVSVNVSARQLVMPKFVEQVQAVLQESNINPALLTIELTESAMISDAVLVGRVLSELRALGVQLHLDDFGTGYSSLSSLHEFPLHGLKIDRSFLKNMSQRRNYMAVVQAIISLARHMGMTLIAEGIETAEQVQILQMMDCDLAQGYYFGRPEEVSVAEARLAAPLPAIRIAA